MQSLPPRRPQAAQTTPFGRRGKRRYVPDVATMDRTTAWIALGTVVLVVLVALVMLAVGGRL